MISRYSSSGRQSRDKSRLRLAYFIPAKIIMTPSTAGQPDVHMGLEIRKRNRTSELYPEQGQERQDRRSGKAAREESGTVASYSEWDSRPAGGLLEDQT